MIMRVMAKGKVHEVWSGPPSPSTETLVWAICDSACTESTYTSVVTLIVTVTVETVTRVIGYVRSGLPVIKLSSLSTLLCEQLLCCASTPHLSHLLLVYLVLSHS